MRLNGVHLQVSGLRARLADSRAETERLKAMLETVASERSAALSQVSEAQGFCGGVWASLGPGLAVLATSFLLCLLLTILFCAGTNLCGNLQVSALQRELDTVKALLEDMQARAEEHRNSVGLLRWLLLAGHYA